MWGKEVFHEKIIAVPKPDDQILESDTLVLFGHDNDLGRLAETYNRNNS
jgi:Trk K+ transport system NAD-binding subunit